MYKRVWIETDPRIMGVRNGVYQVELKENKSFVSKEEEDNMYHLFPFKRGTRNGLYRRSTT